MELSSSITFASTSSYLSNGSSPCSAPPLLQPPTPPASDAITTTTTTNTEVVGLTRLSLSLERLLLDPDLNGSADADVIMANGEVVGIHRCILAARSRFFFDLFNNNNNSSSSDDNIGKNGRPRYRMEELVAKGRIGKEAFMAFLGYLYTGKMRPAPEDVVVCVDRMCVHDACRPAIRFVVELMYAASGFIIPELVSLFQLRLLNLVEKALVEDVIPILQVAYHSQLSQLLTNCVQRVARSDLDNISLEKELPQEVADEIKQIRRKSQANEASSFIADQVHEKRVRSIHRALDSDDVELVKLLLNESSISLDDANALHYAVAYCDSKVVQELLDLGQVNLNLKNSRGYTPLHLAAMRGDPAILMSLLTKGASVSETTTDGRTAASICRRLTRSKDYNARMEKGRESNKDRLCVDILEREMMRNPMAMEDSVTSPLLADNLHMKLLYLENRVKVARSFFPAEAKAAMQIAQAESTSEFEISAAPSTSDKLREVDLNESPTVNNKRLRERVDALMKTVELGRRYFPNCSQVLDKFLEDDLPESPDIFDLQKGTPDEQQIKKMRICELKEDVCKALSKDKAESTSSGFSSSSPSLSALLPDNRQNKAAKR